MACCTVVPVFGPQSLPIFPCRKKKMLENFYRLNFTLKVLGSVRLKTKMNLFQLKVTYQSCKTELVLTQGIDFAVEKS